MARKTQSKRKSTQSTRTRAKADPAAPRERKQRVVPHTWERKFFEALKVRPVISYAAETAGIDRQVIFRLRESDPEFAATMKAAMDVGIERAEAECWRRGVNGTLKPVYQQGAKVGDVREFSDQLAMFMLRAHKPEVYREKIDVLILVRQMARKVAEDRGLDADEFIALAEKIVSGEVQT